MRVLVDEERVVASAARVGIPPERAQELWADLALEQGTGSRVRDVAWYGGGLVTVAACAYFLGSSWGTAGPAVGLAVAAVYAVAALLGAELLRARGLAVPAALLGLVVVALVPVAVVALEDLTTFVTDDRSVGLGSWVREDVTVTGLLGLVVGGAVLARYRRPFLVAPVLLALGWTWTGFSDAAGLRVPGSVLLTAVLLGTAFALDRASRQDEADRVHVAALLSLEHLLWQVLAIDAGTNALLHGLGGAVAVAVAVATGRRLYLGAGALGIFGALSYLAFEVFSGSLLFPLALAALGIAVVLGGVRLDGAVRSA